MLINSFQKILSNKHLVFFFFTFIIGFFLIGGKKAEAKYIEPSLLDTQNAYNDSGMNLNTFAAEVGANTANWITFSFFGPTKPVQLGYDKDGTPIISYVREGGIIKTTIGLIGLTFAPPVRTSTYIASIINNSVFSSPVLAAPLAPYAGGNKVLEPVLEIWKVFRNIAYVFFVVVLTVIGFMVMFRKKIDPQTVVSVQSSIPSIAVGLVLVTLSYAISSLIVDILQIGMEIVFALMKNNGFIAGCFFSGSTCPPATSNSLNIFNLLTQVIVTPNIDSTAISTGTGLSSAIGYVWGVVDNMLKVIDVIKKVFPGQAGQPEGQSLLGVILAIMVVFTTFKLFLGLLTRFVQIIIGTIFSPFVFLFGTLPGNSKLITDWLRSMIANALVFPAVFFLILLASAIGGAPLAWRMSAVPGLQDIAGSFKWAPDLIYGPLNTAAVSNFSTINALIAFGIILILPNVPEMIEHAFEVKAGAQVDTSSISRAARFIPVIGSFIG